MFERFFHVNICVRDLDRSIPFYQELGFTKLNDFVADDPDLIRALVGVAAKKARGAFMRLGNDPDAPVLDLVQFFDPPTQDQPYPTLNHVGICRIAFVVDDIDKTHEKLKALNVEFVGQGGSIHLPNVATVRVLMFKDPDGTVLDAVAKIPGA